MPLTGSHVKAPQEARKKTMEYNTYSILPFEEQPGRWFAKIQRLDGRPIKRVGVDGAKESITTPAARYSADDAIAFAKEAIDGGGID
jgi:hypothetical protein